MTASPRISVCMTVYNGEDYLRPAIDSLLAQDYADFEILVVDNGSTDGTAAILAGYDHPRLRKLRCEHVSYTQVKKLVTGEAQGELLAVLDADDIARPDRLSRQAAMFDADPQLALVGSWVRLIDGQDQELGQLRPPADHVDLVDRMPFENPIAHSSFMFRKAAAMAVGGYRQDLGYAPDFGLELALCQAGYKLAVVPELLIGLRQHSGQSTYSPAFAATRNGETYGLFLSARQLPGVSAQALAQGRETLALSALRQAWALLRLGRPLHAATWALRGVRWAPYRAAYTVAQQSWGCMRRCAGLS